MLVLITGGAAETAGSSALTPLAAAASLSYVPENGELQKPKGGRKRLKVLASFALSAMLGVRAAFPYV